MIEPGLATMLCFVQTDAVVEDPDAQLRSGRRRLLRPDHRRRPDEHQRHASSCRPPVPAGKPLPAGLLEAVLLQLAIEIVRDGEGAARVGRIEVSGAASAAEAERVARAIANSPLVKTALFGRDPNWGRIAQAAGAALAGEDIGGDRRRTSIEAAELGAETARGRDRPAARPRRRRGPRLVLRPGPRVHPHQRRVHDVSDPTIDDPSRADDDRAGPAVARSRSQRRDAARGAALHPGVPRPHRGHQVRRRGDARGGAARGLRHRRRPAQVRRPQPGDRPRRRPRDHRATWSSSGSRSSFHEGLRVSDAETVEVAKMVLLGKLNSDIVQRLNRARPARGRALRRGRRPVRGRAGRQRRAGRLRRRDRAGRRRRAQPHRRRLHPGDRLARPPTATASPTTSTPTRRPARSRPRSAPTRRSSSPTSRAGSPTPATRAR